MKRWEYQAYGLRIRSGFPLPLRSRGSCTPGDPDLEVSESKLGIEGGGRRVGPFCRTKSGELVLDGPNLGMRLNSDEIILYNKCDETRGLQRTIVAGMGLGLVLLMRGNLVLHGSAVGTPGGAILLLGSVSMGKSSLAAALWKLNCPIITDDICAIASRPHGHMLLGGGSEITLWGDTIRQMGLGRFPARPVRQGVERYSVTLGPCPTRTTYPISRIFVLQRAWNGPAGARTEAVRGIERLPLLLRYCRWAGWIDDSGQSFIRLKEAASLSSKVPIRRLHIHQETPMELTAAAVMREVSG